MNKNELICSIDESAVPFPWQQAQWNFIQHCCRKNQLAHALLLVGQSGLGKLLFAKRFASVFLCEKNKGFTQTCDHCSACQLTRANTHPDLYYLQPDHSEKIIKIDQVRHCIEHVNQTAKKGANKIVILNPAESMTIQANNALLKTIEEPTDGTFFILLTAHSHLLIPTIRSRCQLIKFLIPTPSIAYQWLSSQRKSSSLTIENELLLSLASGSPIAALALLHENLLMQRTAFFEMLTCLTFTKSSESNPIYLAANLLKINVHQTINWFITTVYDLIRIHAGLELDKIIHKDKIDCLQSLARVTKNTFLFFYLDKLYDLVQQLNQVHLNHQLLLEDLLCTWFQCVNNKKIHSL